MSYTPVYKDLHQARLISYDIETFDPELDGPVWGRPEDKGKDLGPGEFRPETYILGFSLADETGWKEYYNLAHPEHLIGNDEAEIFMKLIHEDPSRFPKPACREKNLTYLREVMSLPVPKLGVNLQYDLGFTEDKEHIPVMGKLMDLMNAEALIDENQGQYNLDYMSMKYLGIHKAKEMPEAIAEQQGWITSIEGCTPEEAASIKRKGGCKDFRKFLWRMTYEQVHDYGCGDVYNPIRIWEKQEKLLEAQHLMEVYDRECKIIRFCRKLRHNGMRIDIAKRNRYIGELQEKILELDRNFQKKYGTVNYNSSKQIAGLCDRYGVPYALKEETGNPVLDSEALTKAAHKFPMCADILAIRGMQKVEGTFLNGAFVRSVTPDNRIHAMYYNTKIDHGEGDISGTVSGRFSSCIAKGQRVLTRRGEVNIEDIRKGDEVLTHRGNWAVVQELLHKGYKKCIHLQSADGRYSIRCTPQHLIYDGKAWCKAADVQHFLNPQKEIIPNIIKINNSFFMVAQEVYDIGMYHPDHSFFVNGIAVHNCSPNLEQVSAHKGDKGTLKDWYTSLCRDIFLPEEGEMFSSVDLSGAEVRFIAHYGPLDSPAANDFRRKFCENPNLDTHQYVADLLGWSGPMGRKRAKTLTFASAYGSGPKHIAEVFDVSLEEAKEIYNIFHAKFPVIRETSREVENISRVRGYIRTIDGRRRHLPDVRSAYKMYNSLIQGSVAGYHKIATCNAMDAGIYEVLTPLNTIHDENTQSMPMTKQGQEALIELKRIFESALPLRVPMVSMPELGWTWGTTEEIHNLRKFFDMNMDFKGYFEWQEENEKKA